VDALRYTPIIGWWQAVVVVVIVGVALSLVVWAVSAVVIDKWIRRRQRPSPLERAQPYQPAGLGDQAENWLREQ
jgi:hypothetical protein